MLVLEKGAKVFSCCGQYIVLTQDAKNCKPKCPRCGQALTGALRVPTIMIGTKK